MKIDGSVAVVTGGAQGVGKAIVEALLQRGANVCIADINKAIGEVTVKELAEAYGDKIFFKECDVTKDADIRALFGAVQETTGRAVDILVNNAGILREKYFASTVAINLEAQIRCAYVGAEYMGLNSVGKSGIMIFTASILGLVPSGQAPVYSATKHGLVAFVRSMALSPSSIKSGLRFNVLCPSFVDTPLITDEGIKRGLVDDDSSAMFIALRNSIDLLKPSDVGKGCIQLIEDDTLNGKALLINHGDTGHGDVLFSYIEPQTDIVKP
ncbi:unnamed protein product [Owenia fusiformis]|uniref:15-hydroxyprostaglandin dehydrogenase [NAD(+)] n=1 Tax=Owenia fusiformis TaxID=6347 RepID=A0A8J1UNP8_OWEFU|nr:unnamed protein product [Owenia fusiformis]